MKEIWKDIKGYESLYRVSNLGRVKSLERKRKTKNNNMAIVKERILKHKIDKYGYCSVSLSKEGKLYYYTVHRLVAQAFIPNPNNLPQVNHKDENKLNNCVDNLEWCTNKYNSRFSNSIPILQFDLQGNFIKEWECITDASTSLNIDRKTICAICKHKKHYYTAKGFTFQYKYLTPNYFRASTSQK